MPVSVELCAKFFGHHARPLQALSFTNLVRVQAIGKHSHIHMTKHSIFRNESDELRCALSRHEISISADSPSVRFNVGRHGLE